MHEIKAIIRSNRLDNVVHALRHILELPGITVSVVIGYGRLQPTDMHAITDFGQVAMTKLEIVAPDSILAEAVSTIRQAAFTGHPGDGKIFVLPVEQALKIRSEARGLNAL
ncbi:MAG: P-II family nitrogen regulator [Bryobacterales bacterium]|nr:P-II family nitrogen regulator [Bryobacterales bacterium]